MKHLLLLLWNKNSIFIFIRTGVQMERKKGCYRFAIEGKKIGESRKKMCVSHLIHKYKIKLVKN